MAARVLLVSDQADMLRIWAYALRQRQHQVSEVSSAAGALRLAAEQSLDLIVIDAFGGLDPIDLCRRLRSIRSNPILLLTPEHSETYLLRAYEAGADECITRPISPLLFLAKAQAWLRHTQHSPVEGLMSVQAGDMQLNLETRELVIGGRVHHLTNLEYRLLQSLMTHPSQIMSTDLLVERLWGSERGDAAMLKNVVYRLRRKIEPPHARQHVITTVPGKGYRLNQP